MLNSTKCLEHSKSFPVIYLFFKFYMSLANKMWLNTGYFKILQLDLSSKEEYNLKCLIIACMSTRYSILYIYIYTHIYIYFFFTTQYA